MIKAADEQFVKMLQGYTLATALIVYHLPDFPHLVQEYIWQEYDMAPEFPKLFSFLEFWEREIDGPLQGVTVVSRRLIKPSEIRRVEGVLTIH